MAIFSNYLRDERLARIADYVVGEVADIGCGPAMSYERNRDKIARYVGVDRDERLLEETGKQYPDARFFTRDLDKDELDLPGKFDSIIMAAVIEHIFNLKHLFLEAKKHLKPGGTIVVTTPTIFGNDVVHRLGTFLGIFSQHAADDHIVVFNRKRLEILAREFGLDLERYERFEFGCNQLAVFRDRDGQP